MRIQGPWNDLLVEPSQSEHLVQLYQDERSLIEAVALYAGVGLGRGEAVILVATPAHLEAVRRRLTDQGFDADELEQWRQLTVVDAAKLLSSFLVKGLPDAARFKAAVGRLIEDARGAGGYSRVRAYGEMVNLIWREDLLATTRLEELWNDVIEAHRITLFCAYCVDGSDDARRFPPKLRALHSHMIPLEASA
jgi:hypothetical protein